MASPAPTRRGQQTRERVLEEATRLFAERGFAAVTMRAIGDAAGLDNSSLYRHFESKTALARTVVDQASADLLRAVGARLADAPGTLEGLVGVASAASLHLWDRPQTARLLLHSMIGARDDATGFALSMPVDDVGLAGGALYRGFMSLYERALAQGEVRRAAPIEAFAAILGAALLRPATAGSLLASREPRRSERAKRRAWAHELEAILRGALAP